MTPYYQDSFVTIYHGDCREILPLVPSVDFVVTDPPYGTGWVRGGGDWGEFAHKHTQADWDVWSTDWLRLTTGRVAFCAPNSRLAEVESISDSVLWWRKTNPRPNGPEREPIGIIGVEVAGEFPCYNGDTAHHPCEKPIALMRWIIGRLGPWGLVVDPFMGSGSTLRAAKDLGLTAIGIEIKESYCEIAAKRMSQEVLVFG